LKNLALSGSPDQWAYALNVRETDNKLEHTYVVLLGSNIAPEKNIPVAVQMLCRQVSAVSFSHVWETEPVGSPGSPFFLNVAVALTSLLPLDSLRNAVLLPIEDALGRVRTNDKNAPRTIDLDVILMDGIVIDRKLWTLAFVAIPIAEILPSLKDLEGSTLIKTAERLHMNYRAVVRKDVLIRTS
jgi:2-amino-4-hydroxy-6-hydroxymethyldihydropteridine diphosphokinase